MYGIDFLMQLLNLSIFFTFGNILTAYSIRKCSNVSMQGEAKNIRPCSQKLDVMHHIGVFE